MAEPFSRFVSIAAMAVHCIDRHQTRPHLTVHIAPIAAFG